MTWRNNTCDVSYCPSLLTFLQIINSMKLTWFFLCFIIKMLDKGSIYTKCMYNCLLSWKSRITIRRKMCIYHVANILPCDNTFWVLLRIKRGIMFITPSFTRMVQVGKQSKFINCFGMLLHAFPSMFVCSLREFPENCADHMSMILKLLREVHLLDLYVKTINFLFYSDVFNSCQKWLNILIQSVISSVEVYDKQIITCHFSYHTLYQSSFIYHSLSLSDLELISLPWADKGYDMKNTM